MGKEKATTTNVVNQTTTPTPSAEETRLNQLDLQSREANQQGITDMQKNSLNLGNLLLTGQNLPGYLQGLPGGISPEVTQSIVDQSLRDIRPGFQQGGILDSGVAASISARTAGDIRRGSAEFNLNNLQQLLNLAVGGQAQIQQPILAQSQALGGRLAGLRSTNTSGTGSTTNTSMNPFLKSFQTGLGSSLGSGSFGNFKAF
jgi:hypothetical protein